MAISRRAIRAIRPINWTRELASQRRRTVSPADSRQRLIRLSLHGATDSSGVYLTLAERY